MYMNVRIPEKLGNRLEHMAQETGHTKSYYIRKALEEFIEDREDYILAVARLEENNPSYTLEEVKREFGLDNKDRRKSKKRAKKAGASSTR